MAPPAPVRQKYHMLAHARHKDNAMKVKTQTRSPARGVDGAKEERPTRLDHKTREIIRLLTIRGATREEISKALEIPASTILVTVRNLRKRGKIKGGIKLNRDPKVAQKRRDEPTTTFDDPLEPPPLGAIRTFTSGCKAISGEPKGPWRQCAREVVDKTSWCAYHTGKFYAAPKPQPTTQGKSP